jgi:hypothetical protein
MNEFVAAMRARIGRLISGRKIEGLKTTDSLDSCINVWFNDELWGGVYMFSDYVHVVGPTGRQPAFKKFTVIHPDFDPDEVAKWAVELICGIINEQV